MTPEPTAHEERSRLLDSLFDGDISEADFLRLEAELSVAPEFRQEYYSRVQLEWLLEREATDAAPFPEPTLPKTKHRWSVPAPLWAGLLLGVAASMLIAIAMYPFGTEGKQSIASVDVDEPSAIGFAVLSGQSDVVWASHSSAPRELAVGSLLPSGELHLESGLVHLELFSGVQMVIEGEAVFTIDSPMQVSMTSGRARALVPEPAQGFRIKTSTGDVVDLGTEFTIDVEETGARVQVVDGEVELHPNGSDIQKIQDGEAWKWSDTGTLNEVSPEIELVGPSAFQNELALRQTTRIDRWQRSREDLHEDPRLIACYQTDPQDGWSRRLDNLAAANDEVASAGAVVAAGRSEDRWGREGGALDFSQMGSRVRVSVPGEHRGLTLYCWVKINSLDRWYNSLFLTDGHQEREPHWQIMDDGRMFFSVKLPSGVKQEGERQHHIFYSPPFWNTSLSGRWLMLATTYDVDAKQVTHFLNGKPISSEAIADPWLVDEIKIGAGSICNWSEPMYRTDPNFVVRNLNGSMDEFAIFSGALSSAEILNLFETGNPNEP